jgi:hypothetical protein
MLVHSFYRGFNHTTSFFFVAKSGRDFGANKVIFSGECVHEMVLLYFKTNPLIIFVEPSCVKMLVTNIKSRFDSRFLFDMVATKSNLRDFPPVVERKDFGE